MSVEERYQGTHKRTLLEALFVKAVTANVTKSDEGEVVTGHRFIADWTIFAVNWALLLWLGLL